MEDKGIFSWPILEKEVFSFPWRYEMYEYCLILKGEVTVDANSQKYEIKVGDFVKFSKGLKCHWNIIKDIRKHYQFV